MKNVATIFRSWSQSRKLGASVLAAAVFSFLSFAILLLEYGVLNFGDSDLPPYQRDTVFERVVDAVWFSVTGCAGLLWLFIVIYINVLLFKASVRLLTRQTH